MSRMDRNFGEMTRLILCIVRLTLTVFQSAFFIPSLISFAQNRIAKTVAAFITAYYGHLPARAGCSAAGVRHSARVATKALVTHKR